MAFTNADILAAEAAINTIIARGAAEVEINGRKVKFLSLDALQKAIDNMRQSLIKDQYGNSFPVEFTEVTD